MTSKDQEILNELKINISKLDNVKLTQILLIKLKYLLAVKRGEQSYSESIYQQILLFSNEKIELFYYHNDNLNSNAIFDIMELILLPRSSDYRKGGSISSSIKSSNNSKSHSNITKICVLVISIMNKLIQKNIKNQQTALPPEAQKVKDQLANFQIKSL